MKTNHAIIFCLIIQLVCLKNVLSCSCGPPPQDFCSSVNENTIIVLAEISDSISSDKRRIKILENIHQEINNEEVVLIGQDGFNCGLPLGNFHIGDTLIMGLYMISDTSYIISMCGKFYLYFNSDIVSPHVSPEINSMSYLEFKDNLQSCLLLSSSENIVPLEDVIQIIPNPFHNNFSIQFSPQTIVKHISIFSISGELLFEKEISEQNNIDIQLENLPSGMFLLQIKTINDIRIEKIQKI